MYSPLSKSTEWVSAKEGVTWFRCDSAVEAAGVVVVVTEFVEQFFLAFLAPLEA